MREFLKLVVALGALVFVSATVARSIAFAETPAAMTQAAAHVSEVRAEPAAEATDGSLAEARSLALALAGIACVGFMAGRRSRIR